jgi:hypothetical protein
MSHWFKDPVAWQSKSLAERLSLLKKHYCTGPSGQSFTAGMIVALTESTLKEAIALAKANEATTGEPIETASEQV